MEVKLVITLLAWMLFCISSRGYPIKCNSSDLSTNITSVPGQTGLNSSYLVTVKNRCNCPQTNVKLTCIGFKSSIRVKPAGIITVDGDNTDCTLNVPVTKGKVVEFYYWSTTKFIFAVVTSNVSCSVA